MSKICIKILELIVGQKINQNQNTTMTTLKIDDSKAKELYRNPTPEFIKQVLEDSFPKGFFSEKITDRIKTYEDALKEIKITSLLPILNYETTNKEVLSIIALAKLTIIAKALNEGWKPNWNDSNENKYFPVFNMSGFGFSYSDYVNLRTFSYCGSRLCFKTRELSDYSGKQFESLYKDLLTN